MKKVYFWLDYAMDAGGDECGRRFEMWLDLSEGQYVQLAKACRQDPCERLNSFDSPWEGFDELYRAINDSAVRILTELMRESCPELGAPAEVFWELKEDCFREANDMERGVEYLGAMSPVLEAALEELIAPAQLLHLDGSTDGDYIGFNIETDVPIEDVDGVEEELRARLKLGEDFELEHMMDTHYCADWHMPEE